MLEFFSSWFETSGFMPHGHCWLWTPAMLWLQVGTNLAIGLAYVAIAATLAYLVYRIRDIPFRRVYLAFGVFIVTCGFTHFMDVWVIWHPDYWTDVSIRLLTAVASVGTALLLPPLVPKVVAVARGARAAHERGMQLETAVHDLERLYERATELDSLKTQFFANVSHELRTPLALILGPLDRLDGMGLPDEARREVEVAARNARLLLNQVDALLDLAALEAGETKLRRERVDLAMLVRTAASNFDGIARERRMKLKLHARGPVWAVVDAERIRRVVLNLLSNAFKYTPPGGTVRVTLREESGEARLEVADSGPGIPVDQRSLVFERFRRLEGAEAARVGGTGLGLPIVKDFVELHGGRIEMGDAPEGGLLVTIQLPRRTDVARPEAPDLPAAPVDLADLDVATEEEEVAPDVTDERCVALVVEDNRDLRDFLRRTLEPGYQVVTASNGETGAARAEKLVPDVIVTDLMMPVASGEVLVQRVRAQPALADVPIVVLTARADEALRIELLRSGVQDWVQKPFLPEELRARVDNLVQVARVRRILQEQLATQSTDLEAMARDLGVARELAERSSELKSSFLRAVSHELRSPLHALGLQLRLLERGDATVRERMMDRMGESLVRMRSLVEALLQKARLEGQAVQFRVTSFDALALTHEVVQRYRQQALDKGLRVSMVAEPQMPLLRSDPDLVKLILSNLVGNAVKFTQRGEVRVELTVQNDRHVYVVTDTGPGLAPATQGLLFEPFTEADAEHAHQPGLGLGLSLVRDLARALGGEVAFTSSADGTEMRVALPSLERDVVA